MLSRLLFLVLLSCVAGCGPAFDEEQVEDILALEGDPSAGESFFSMNCERCHGPGGRGGRGPDLRGSSFSRREIVETVLRGPLSMPSFENESDQDLANVTAYVHRL